jgi:hypothetical protein
MISVVDLHGNVYSVPSESVTTNTGLYEALHRQYAGDFKLFFDHQYLDRENRALDPRTLNGSRQISLIPDLPQYAFVSPHALPLPAARFANFHFLPFRESPGGFESDDDGATSSDSFEYSSDAPSSAGWEMSDAISHSLFAMDQSNNESDVGRSDEGRVVQIFNGQWLPWSMTSGSQSEAVGSSVEEEAEEEEAAPRSIVHFGILRDTGDELPIDFESMSEDSTPEEPRDEALTDHERLIINSRVEVFRQERRVVINLFLACGRDAQLTAEHLAAMRQL